MVPRCHCCANDYKLQSTLGKSVTWSKCSPFEKNKLTCKQCSFPLTPVSSPFITSLQADAALLSSHSNRQRQCALNGHLRQYSTHTYTHTHSFDPFQWRADNFLANVSTGSLQLRGGSSIGGLWM